MASDPIARFKEIRIHCAAGYNKKRSGKKLPAEPLNPVAEVKWAGLFCDFGDACFFCELNEKRAEGVLGLFEPRTAKRMPKEVVYYGGLLGGGKLFCGVPTAGVNACCSDGIFCSGE